MAGNDSTSEDTAINTSADLSISKTDSVDPVIAGTGFSYTVTVSNAGPSDALTVSLTDVLPAEVVFVSATPDQGSCAEAAGTVTCSLGTVAAGASVDVVIAVTVSADTLPGPITNNASVSSATSDPTPGNNSTSEGTTITASADLSIAKTDSVDPVVAGTGFSYTVTVSNAGPSDATGVAVTDVLPAGLTFVSATPDQGSCSEAGGTVSCSLGSIADGASVDVVITVTVPADTIVGSSLSNTAIVSATSSDPNASDNTDTEITVVSGSADLSITKVDSPDPVVAGANLTYTLTVANSGPSDAVAVQVVDVLPVGVSFVSASSGQGACSEVGGTVTCSLGTVASGGIVVITIDVQVDADLADGATLVNDASVSSGTADPVGANNSDSEPTTVTTSADVSITKIDSIDPVVAGTPLTYTVVVSNAGPSDALAVVVTDVLPAGLSFVSATSTQGACVEAAGTVTCSPGTVVAGGLVTITIVTGVDADAVGTIVNAASVVSSTSDPALANNADTENTATTGEADLWVTKSSAPVPFVPGGPIVYTITVGNDGPSDVVGASVSDVFPAEVLTPSWTCAGTGGGVCAAAGTGDISESVDLPVGATVVFTVTGTVDPGVSPAAIISNTATVAPPVGVVDPDPGDNSDTDSNPFAPTADLAVTKTAAPTTVVAGENLVYTVAVANGGPAAATDVVLTDTLPAGVAYVSAVVTGGSGGETCGEAAGVVTCALGGIAPAATETITITVTVDPDVLGALVNTAAVTASSPDSEQCQRPGRSNRDGCCRIRPVAGQDGQSDFGRYRRLGHLHDRCHCWRAVRCGERCSDRSDPGGNGVSTRRSRPVVRALSGRLSAAPLALWHLAKRRRSRSAPRLSRLERSSIPHLLRATPPTRPRPTTRIQPLSWWMLSARFAQRSGGISTRTGTSMEPNPDSTMFVSVSTTTEGSW